MQNKLFKHFNYTYFVVVTHNIERNTVKHKACYETVKK